MAWLCVDQKIRGGKLRSLYKALECSPNESIGILITLWLWGIDNAEQDGYIRDADKADIADALRNGLAPGLDPEKVVDSLIETRWIDVDGEDLYLHDWSEWRKYYISWLNSKEKNAARQARFKAKQGNVTGNVTDNVTGNVIDGEEPEDPPEPPPDPPKPEKTEKPDKYGPEFEAFWAAYPRHKDKGGCFTVYKTRRKEGFSAEEMLAAAKEYADECTREKTEERYIKHGKTFLGPSLAFTEYSEKWRASEARRKADEASQNPFRGKGG